MTFRINNNPCMIEYIQEDDGTIYIDTITTPITERCKGHASSLLYQFIRLYTKHDITLIAHTESDITALVNWYKSFGFVATHYNSFGYEMLRSKELPKTPLTT